MNTKNELNPNQIAEGDRVVYQSTSGDGRDTGTVTKLFEENDVFKIEVKHDDGTNLTYKTNDPALEPLFFLNKENGKKTQTRFSYNEVVALINDGKIFGLNYDALGKANVNSLIIGNKTGLIDNIQLKKNGEEQAPGEVFNKSGRINLYVKDGKINVNLDLKHQKLDLSQIYDKPLTKIQQDQLKKTGELGLVSDFTNKQTGEIFNAWVSVDPLLNKLVARPEGSIKIDTLYGRTLNEKEQSVLKSGKGALMEFKTKTGDSFKAYVQTSVASKNSNGLKIYSEEKAKELKLVNALAPQKKKSKSQGVKM